MLARKRPAVIEGDIARIPLGKAARDGYAIVNKKYAWIDKYYWNLNTNNYARSTSLKKYMHQVIIQPTLGYVVDHINGDKLDNREENLRVATRSQNSFNRRLNKNNTTGYKGIFKDGNLWYAKVVLDKKEFRGIKGFNTKHEAAVEYNRLAKKHYKEFAMLNKTI